MSVQPEVSLKLLVVTDRSIGIPTPRVPLIQDPEDRCSPCLERISNHPIESWSYFVSKMSSTMVVVFLHVHRTPEIIFNNIKVLLYRFDLSVANRGVFPSRITIPFCQQQRQ